MRLSGEDAPAPLASASAAPSSESVVLQTDVFYRLIVARDACGVVHYAVNGAHSHSTHNGDAANGASSISHPLLSCAYSLFNESNTVSYRL
jgi:hypothetical protein